MATIEELSGQSASAVAAAFSTGTVWWGQPNASFGGRNHYDGTCLGSISVQWRGTKQWTLWSPDWPVGGSDGAVIAPGTCFQGTTKPSDLLFWAPGWFHSTTIGNEESVASAFYFVHPPVYAKLPLADVDATVEGFGSCARGEFGWVNRSADWLRLLDDQARFRSGNRSRTHPPSRWPMVYAVLGVGTVVSIVLFGAYIRKCRAHNPAPLQVWLRTYRRRIFDAALDAPPGGDKLV